MNTRGLLVTIFAVALSVAPQLDLVLQAAAGHVFCHADFAEGWDRFSTLGRRSWLNGSQRFRT